MKSISKQAEANGIVIASALLLVLILGGMIYLINRPPHEIVIPDDTAVSRNILIQRFQGPRYVQLGDDTEVPYLTEKEVRRQLEPIIKLRQLSPRQVAQIDAIIAKLSEPAPSRLTGEDRVNVLRLNLALDEATH